MTKKEIADRVAERTGLTRTDVSVVLDEIIETIKWSMERGHSIEIRDFGTFKVKLNKARKARNPKSGEVVLVPERKVPRFKAAAAFKHLINISNPA